MPALVVQLAKQPRQPGIQAGSQLTVNTVHHYQPPTPPSSKRNALPATATATTRTTATSTALRSVRDQKLLCTHTRQTKKDSHKAAGSAAGSPASVHSPWSLSLNLSQSLQHETGVAHRVYNAQRNYQRNNHTHSHTGQSQKLGGCPSRFGQAISEVCLHLRQ